MPEQASPPCSIRHPGLLSQPPSPPPPLFMRLAANTLQGTSAYLSCDHMLPQPSAQGQPALLPALSCQKDAGCCAGQLQGTPCIGQCLLSGPEEARTCLFCPLTGIASP